MVKGLQDLFLRLTRQTVPEPCNVLCEGNGRVHVHDVDRLLAQPHVQRQRQAVRDMAANGEFSLFC